MKQWKSQCEKGKKALRLDALKSNLPAQKMYEKAGFTYRGEQRLFTENTGMTDFLYYEKIPAEIWNRKDDRDEGSSD